MRAYTAWRQRGFLRARTFYRRAPWVRTLSGRVSHQTRAPAPATPIFMLDDDTRYRLFRLLAEHPRISQRELANALGLSLGKTNYSVRALVERGWIKVQNFRNSDNKLAYAYVLTPNGVSAKVRATVDFLRSKQAEFERLEGEIEQLRQEIAAESSEPERQRSLFN